jgi:outer membrane protein with beta-barrel domain
MRVRVSVVFVVAALGLARPAVAQRTGTVEVGGFLRFTDFDNSLHFSNKVGFGGRFGVFVVPHVSVEVDYSSTSSDSGPSLSVKSTPLHVFGVYNFPADPRADIVLGFGYVHNKYSDGVSSTDNGVAGLVGVRYRFRDMLALRLDANEDFMPSPANKSPTASFNGNLGLQLGVSAVINTIKK